MIGIDLLFSIFSSLLDLLFSCLLDLLFSSLLDLLDLPLYSSPPASLRSRLLPASLFAFCLRFVATWQRNDVRATIYHLVSRRFSPLSPQ